MRNLIVCVVSSLWFMPLAAADVPQLVRYQGTAVDSQGIPLEGPYNLTFRLYNAETSGNKVWEEAHAAVPLSNGHFSVLLGQHVSLSAMEWSHSCWLSVQVNGDSELLPRQQITSVPLALQTESAERIIGSENISPVNLLKNGSFESWREQPYPVLTDWVITSTVAAWDSIQPETGVVKIGALSASLVRGWLSQEADVTLLRGHPVTFSAWVFSTTPNKPRIQIVESSGASAVQAHSGSGQWEYLRVTKMIEASAASVSFEISQFPETLSYVDGAMAVPGPMPFAFSPNPVDGIGPISVTGGNVGIGTVAPTHILTIQPGSPTDPIADSWLTYPCDRQHKQILRTLMPTEGRLDQLRSIKLYEWTRRPAVHDEEVMEALGKRTPSSSDVEKMRQTLMGGKQRLAKFQAKRVGIAIDDANVPAEVLAFDEEGEKSGIDLLAYVGYLHATLKEAAVKLDQLEKKLDAQASK